jgi:diguanylate cyclase (GGDEF)-like protein
MRALDRALPEVPASESFFMHLGQEGRDLRDRIAQHLDAALFELVIASEVRALSNCGSFEVLFDRLAQLLSQLVPYRWLAVGRDAPERVAIHCHPSAGEQAQTEVGEALGAAPSPEWLRLEDEDAHIADSCPAPVVERVSLGAKPIARVVVAPVPGAEEEARSLLAIVAREIAAPLRMAELVEQSQRLACLDSLTGLLNRRAMRSALDVELARSRRYGHPLSLVMIDIDHFKAINDKHGHAGGDEVLRKVSALLSAAQRRSDLCGRWGGEEFLVALSCTDAAGAEIAAERFRRVVESAAIENGDGVSIFVTASLGVATLQSAETIEACLERADRDLYAAKAAGRNRVVCDDRREPAHTVDAQVVAVASA